MILSEIKVSVYHLIPLRLNFPSSDIPPEKQVISVIIIHSFPLPLCHMSQ